MHSLFLTKVESGTKGDKLKKNTSGDHMKSNKKALGKNQVFYRNGFHKAAEKLLSQHFNTLSVQQRSVLARHVPRVIEVRNV